MKGTRVDPKNNTVAVEPGCTQGDMDHATHPFGLAVPAGIVSTTGVAGLTLGGGFGYLSRQYGLTVDNLIEADVVLADGRFVTASDTHHQDLFWGLRGGGGNFGVVTRFVFQAHPVSTVFAGPVFWEIEHGREIMRWYRDFIVAAPRKLSSFLGLKTVPSTEPFPQEIRGRRICALITCFNGPEAEAQEALRPLRDHLPEPILDGMQEMPFPALQSLFDGLLPTGLQWYWKEDSVKSLSDEAIDIHLQHASQSPSELSLMHLYPINGAVHDGSASATAWNCRDATWSMVIAGIDSDPGKAAQLRHWGRDYWQAIHPHNLEGGYINFMMDDEAASRVGSSYGDNFVRLREIKREYDPENFFRVNQNFAPAGSE